MGFAFNLFILPLLLFTTIGLILAYATGKPAALKTLGVIWAAALLLTITGRLMHHLRRPIKLTKQKIVGEYQIDTSFYTGKNARWQYNHYKFTITNDDSIHFIVMDDTQRQLQVYRHKINYRSGPPDLWSVSADSTHHIIKGSPTLYRGHNKFYYAFLSKKYGNMFFRRVKT